MALGAGSQLFLRAPADAVYNALQWAEWERGIDWGDESPIADSERFQEELDEGEEPGESLLMISFTRQIKSL